MRERAWEGMAVREWMLLASVLGAGVAVRLFAAWCFRHNLNLDAGVVALMAKHIAEGQSLPVFFYGQPHMGSLEALWSGLFCRIFGVTGFAVCLGTAFVSIWLMPVVYCWARSAAGRVAGFSALVLVVIGPGGFFHYNASPRGAYAAALSLGAFVLWYATRMAIRWALDQRQSGWDFFWLGIGAGLAWWNSQLTTAAILAAALLLLIALRRNAFTWRIGTGLLGFLLGSLPFWLYNLRHEWASFTLTGTFGRTSFRDGLVWFFTDRFASLMLPTSAPGMTRYGVAGLYAVVVMGSVAMWVWSLRARRLPLFYTLLGILLFIPLFAALYAASHFAAIPTPRYFLPMVAPLAVLAGIMVAHLQRRLPVWAAYVPVIILLGVQVPVFSWSREFERSAAARMARIKEIGTVLAVKEIDLLYAANIYRAWNFALREQCVFVDVENDFYLPHARRAEWSDHPSVFRDYGQVSGFVRQAGGQHDTIASGRVEIQHSFQPPSVHWAEIPDERWALAIDGSGVDQRVMLTDQRLHTGWSVMTGTQEESIAIHFRHPEMVAGVRLLATHPGGYPYVLSIEGRTPAGDWITCQPPLRFTRWFWSGPRPWWGSPHHRLEARFDPVELVEIRLTHHPERPDFEWSLSSLQLFGPDTVSRSTETESLTLLLDTLEGSRITRLYADRWVANAVARESEGRIRTSLSPDLFPDASLSDPGQVVLTPDTGMLVLAGDAPSLRSALRRRVEGWQEVAIGPWILFRDWPGIARQDPGLAWVGYSAMLDDGRWAEELVRRAHALLKAAPPRAHAAADLLNQALEYNPYHYEARRLLPKASEATGDSGRAGVARSALQEVAVPVIETPVRFPGGIRFLGLGLDRQTIKPGETLGMTLHWSVPVDLDLARYNVFIHFRRDHVLFQDDHILLADVPMNMIASQTGTPVLKVERLIRLPEAISSGPVEIQMGLVDRRHDYRLRASTRLPQRRRAVRLPVEFIIE